MDFGLTICSWATAFIKVLPIVLPVVLLVSLLWKGWRKKVIYTITRKTSLLKVIYFVVSFIIGFALIVLFSLLYAQIISIQCGASQTEINVQNLALAFLGTVSGLAALFGVYLAIQRTDESKKQSKESKRQSDASEREADTAEQGLIAERLNKATEGLGKKEGENPVLEVRLGSLYSLERIAQESIRDHVQIMEMLCAYVRTNSPIVGEMNKIDTITPLRKDIQTALTIIGRRGDGKEGAERLEKEQAQGYQIDLSHCDLHKAELIGADLSRAKINHSYMRFAKLDGANLTGAEIDGTMLVSTELSGANLSYAKISNSSNIENLADVSLMEANLSHAEIKDSNLIGAKLLGANLSHAEIKDSHLTKARLDGANLSHAKLTRSNLTKANLDDADMSDVKIYYSYAHRGNFIKCKNLTQPQLENMFLDKIVKLPKGLKNPIKNAKSYDTFAKFKKDYLNWGGLIAIFAS